jgi:hypothetical protein
MVGQKARSFHEIRLSKHFVLADFLQSPGVWTTKLPIRLSDVSQEQISAGQHLCENLLEPLIKLLGPCSVAAGLCPTSSQGRGHPPDSPHFWSATKGAAADIVFHDWVNNNKPPIQIVQLLHQKQIVFDRLISYAGSEFLCLTYCQKMTSEPEMHRFAVMENIRLPGGKHTRRNLATNFSSFRQRCQTVTTSDDWRRKESEKPSNSPELRPHHIRTGRYFTLLDFCRSLNGYEDGAWVIWPASKEQVKRARMASEILDPLVATTGRVSIVMGAMLQHLANKESNPALWTWETGDSAVELLLPVGVKAADARLTLDHPMITKVESNACLAGETIRVEFGTFQPKTIWSSAAR